MGKLLADDVTNINHTKGAVVELSISFLLGYLGQAHARTF